MPICFNFSTINIVLTISLHKQSSVERSKIACACFVHVSVNALSLSNICFYSVILLSLQVYLTQWLIVSSISHVL